MGILFLLISTGVSVGLIWEKGKVSIKLSHLGLFRTPSWRQVRLLLCLEDLFLAQTLKKQLYNPTV